MLRCSVLLSVPSQARKQTPTIQSLILQAVVGRRVQCVDWRRQLASRFDKDLFCRCFISVRISKLFLILFENLFLFSSVWKRASSEKEKKEKGETQKATQMNFEDGFQSKKTTVLYQAS